MSEEKERQPATEREYLYAKLDQLTTDCAWYREKLQDIHDVAFDGDGMESAKRLGADIAHMVTLALVNRKDRK